MPFYGINDYDSDEDWVDPPPKEAKEEFGKENSGTRRSARATRKRTSANSCYESPQEKKGRAAEDFNTSPVPSPVPSPNSSPTRLQIEFTLDDIAKLNKEREEQRKRFESVMISFATPAVPLEDTKSNTTPVKASSPKGRIPIITLSDDDDEEWLPRRSFLEKRKPVSTATRQLSLDSKSSAANNSVSKPLFTSKMKTTFDKIRSLHESVESQSQRQSILTPKVNKNVNKVSTPAPTGKDDEILKWLESAKEGNLQRRKKEEPNGEDRVTVDMTREVQPEESDSSTASESDFMAVPERRRATGVAKEGEHGLSAGHEKVKTDQLFPRSHRAKVADILKSSVPTWLALKQLKKLVALNKKDVILGSKATPAVESDKDYLVDCPHCEKSFRMNIKALQGSGRI